MDTYRKNNQASTAIKLIGLIAPITVFYFLYQKYANTHAYIDYLDIYIISAVFILNNWFGEAVEFQRGVMGVEDAAIVSLTDYNYIFMNTDKDPLFVLVLLLSVILIWPSNWLSKILSSLLSILLMFAAVVGALVGTFFWATHYPLNYAEVNEWATGVALFISGIVITLCHIGIVSKKP